MKKEKFQKETTPKKEKKKESILHIKTKKWIKSIVMFLVAIIVTLAFIDKAGVAGKAIVATFKILFGDSKITITTIILSLFASGFIFLKAHKRVKVLAITLAILITIAGVSGISNNQDLNQDKIGLIGWVSTLLMNLFGLLVSNIVFTAVILIGLFFFF